MMVCPRLILEYTFWLTLRRQPDYAKKRYLVIVFDPSIYWQGVCKHLVDNAPSVGIVRCSKNPVDAREKNIQHRAKSLSLAGTYTFSGHGYKAVLHTWIDGYVLAAHNHAVNTYRHSTVYRVCIQYSLHPTRRLWASLQPRTPRFSLWRRMEYSARRTHARV